MLGVLVTAVHLYENRLAEVSRQSQYLAKLFVKLLRQLLAVDSLDEERDRLRLVD